MNLMEQFELNEKNKQKAFKMFENRDLRNKIPEDDIVDIANILNCPIQHVFNWYDEWIKNK